MCATWRDEYLRYFSGIVTAFIEISNEMLFILVTCVAIKWLINIKDLL